MRIYSVTKEESERIDIVKMLSIVMVIFAHIYTTTLNFSNAHGSIEMPHWLFMYETSISEIISRAGVPMFIMFSSLFFFAKKRKYTAALKDKFRTMFIPYMFWNTFWAVVWIILQTVPYTQGFFSGNNAGILEGNFMDWLGIYGVMTDFPLDYPLWVLKGLMVMFVVYPPFDYIVEKFPKASFVSIILIAIIPISFPFKPVFCWFILGDCIARLDIHITDVDKLKFPIVAIVYAVEMYFACTVENSILRNISAFLGVLFWTSLSKYIYCMMPRLKSFLLWLLKYLFIIYVFHELTLSSVKKVCLKIFPLTTVSLFIQYHVIPFFVIGICVLLGMFLNKFTPKFYGIITGGRVDNVRKIKPQE